MSLEGGNSVDGAIGRCQSALNCPRMCTSPARPWRWCVENTINRGGGTLYEAVWEVAGLSHCSLPEGTALGARLGSKDVHKRPPPHHSHICSQIKVCLPKGSASTCASALNSFEDNQKIFKYMCVVKESEEACTEAVSNGELDFTVFGGEALVA